MYPLEFANVTKRYRHEVVVDDLTFTVQPGRVTGFLGPNGAGKSTTMKVLLDLAKADHGHATIGGIRYRDMRDPARTIGVVLEPNAFHPGRSGRNHLRILADGAGIESGRIAEMLEAVGLAHAADRHVGGYSLGMRQRLGLAAALLGDPPVLVLDEPGNGLHPQHRWRSHDIGDRAVLRPASPRPAVQRCGDLDPADAVRCDLRGQH
jgi:ABC-2 type transport system ATP-binding protein